MKVRRVLKQISVFALIGTILATDITPAYAVTYTNSVAGVNEAQDVSKDESAECEVYAELGSNFLVTIPKKITLSGSTKTGSYSVDVEGDIAGNEYIAVIPDASFALSSANLASVTALINQDKTDWTYDEILAGNDKVIGQGYISASGITAGSWNGSFNFNVKLAVQRFDITAVNESGTNLNATGAYILGGQKNTLVNELVEAGLIESENEVATLIDVQSDEFSGSAITTFDVSNIAKAGDIVTFYHYDEVDGWEYIGTAVVSENGTATGSFNSFSPVAIAVERSENHTHSYDAGVITKEATCTEDGVKTYTCSKCNGTKTESISKLGHNYSSVVTAPTCTKEGYTTHTCSRCNDSYVDSKVAAIGHSFSSPIYVWSEDKTTCTATRVCSNDTNHKETENATITSAVKVAATCTTKGTTTYTATFKNSAFATQTNDAQDINKLATISLKHGISGSDFSTNTSLEYGGSSSSSSTYFKVISNSSGTIKISSNNNVVSVKTDSFTGGYKITANSAGSAIITITQSADENYSETSLELKVTVTQHAHVYEYNEWDADWEYHYETCYYCGQESGNYGAHDRLGPNNSCSICGYTIR